MTTETAQVVRFSVPLPDPALRSNSRSHWRTKMGAKQDYSRAVWGWWLMAETPVWQAWLPWKAARVTYTWKYCGVAPDAGNIPANLKALQDILCMAPNTGKLAVNNMTYLGIVEDDKHIEPVYLMERVSRRAAQCVEVLIERL